MKLNSTNYEYVYVMFLINLFYIVINVYNFIYKGTEKYNDKLKIIDFLIIIPNFKLLFDIISQERS